MIDNISEIMKVIVKNKTDNRFILGIDGLSRSGKTSLVTKLSHFLQQEHIRVSVFHMDDHIVERKIRYNTGYEQWFEYYNLQWDVPWLKLNLFEKISTSEQLFLPFYNDKTDTQDMQRITLPDYCVVIVEGIFLQRKEWKGYFDYVVYLNCPRKKRFSRESTPTQQDIEKFRNRYWKAEEYYLHTETPMEQADVVIDT